MSNAWIGNGLRVVSWIESGSVAIGYHSCTWCGVDTPSPPDSVVIDLVKRNPNTTTLWPSRDPRDGWQPPGWKWYSDIDTGLLCPLCSEALQNAVKNAHDVVRKSK